MKANEEIRQALGDRCETVDGELSDRELEDYLGVLYKRGARGGEEYRRVQEELRTRQKKSFGKCPHCGAESWQEKLWAWVCKNCEMATDEKGFKKLC